MTTEYPNALVPLRVSFTDSVVSRAWWDGGAHNQGSANMTPDKLFNVYERVDYRNTRLELVDDPKNRGLLAIWAPHHQQYWETSLTWEEGTEKMQAYKLEEIACARAKVINGHLTDRVDRKLARLIGRSVAGKGRPGLEVFWREFMQRGYEQARLLPKGGR